VEKTSGGSSGGKGGGTGGSSSGGSSTGGKGSSGSKGGSTSGSTGGNSGGGGVKIQKPKDLAKLPPTTVTHPDGTAIVMNMQDFCYLPNANALNSVAFQQCLSRKKHDDDDMPVWAIALIAGIFVAAIVVLIAWLLSD
jgi:hypothetical protein